jgi:hypothetical protein
MSSFTVTYAHRPAYALVDRTPMTPVQFQQETSFAAGCKERHEHWILTNAPKPLPLADYRFYFRILLASAVSYHETLNSVGLVKKVIRALSTDPQTLIELEIAHSRSQGSAGNRGSGSGGRGSLNNKTLNQMCQDIDALLCVKGPSAAARALASFGLWDVDFSPICTTEKDL